MPQLPPPTNQPLTYEQVLHLFLTDQAEQLGSGYVDTFNALTWAVKKTTIEAWVDEYVIRMGDHASSVQSLKDKYTSTQTDANTNWKNLIPATETVSTTFVYPGGISTTINNGIDSIVAGTNITIDNTNPAAPIINAIGGVGGASAWGDITGTLSAQTDLNAALGGKAASSHNHDLSYEALGVVAAHAGAADPHSQYLTPTEANVAYSAIGHAHAGVYEPANANIQAHVAQTHAPSNAQANVDITKAEIEAKLTGVISSHSHAGGGSDPWTTVVLASDFVTSSATAVDVTGLFITPTANTRYEIEGCFLLRTATTTVGPRPGVAWPTGMTDGIVTLMTTSSATAFLTANGNINAAVLTAVGGLPTTTQSYPGQLDGLLLAGASPVGTFRVQLASETAGTNVTMKAGSFIKYRIY